MVRIDEMTEPVAGSGALRVVLGDQLTGSLSALADLEPARDIVLLMEVQDEATYVRHHKQKIVLVLSAMRHFAEELSRRGIRVDYVKLDDAGNTGSLTGEVQRAAARHRPERVVATRPGEWRVWEMMQTWQRRLGLRVEIREDDRFLSTPEEFGVWLAGRTRPRMEHFYRHMRRRMGWLMEGAPAMPGTTRPQSGVERVRALRPVGGRWNFDSANRRPPRRDLEVPPVRGFPPDRITREVIELVRRRFGTHVGHLGSFTWAVTRANALAALSSFVEQRLPRFGDYQDAMLSSEDVLFHSALSPYLNLGLLLPREVCAAALAAWTAGAAPLNAVEGFIRQILGWREYVRGLYWAFMPGYADSNALSATRPLPRFYWDGETDMNCMTRCIRATMQNAYAHHIQRLMVTGNFALLAGLSPAAVEEWYLTVYADAYDWVELPNTHGMALFADGGLLASKPYAASAAYINRMSDYCDTCAFDPRLGVGPRACPFNYLYWNFLITHQERFEGNGRMALVYRQLQRMGKARMAAAVQQSETFLEALPGY